MMGKTERNAVWHESVERFGTRLQSIEREKDTGMLVALLNDRLYTRSEDDIEDGQYVSLLQLHIDGFDLYRTSGTHEPDGKRKGEHHAVQT